MRTAVAAAGFLGISAFTTLLSTWYLGLSWRWAVCLSLLSIPAVQILHALYLWNFVMLKDIRGPKSPSFLFGHMALMHLEECDSLWFKWEKE